MAVMHGEGLFGSIVKFGVAMIAANPKLQAVTKLTFVEVLGGLKGDLAQTKAVPPQLAQLLKVLIHSRNQKVIRDLQEELRRKNPPASISVFYGAGHMDDLERRVRRQLDYHPKEDVWVPAFSVDLEASGISALRAGNGPVHDTTPIAGAQPYRMSNSIETTAELIEKHCATDIGQKALEINIDGARYGAFSEIGAGQEVARWFFRVGGASGTVAKSTSAYDMQVSDSIYGPCDRYVSRQRLLQMLDREYRLVNERLGESRGERSYFFAFADTVVAKSYSRKDEAHGWLGIRFQHEPKAPVEIIIHARLLGPNVKQKRLASSA